MAWKLLEKHVVSIFIAEGDSPSGDGSRSGSTHRRETIVESLRPICNMKWHEQKAYFKYAGNCYSVLILAAYAILLARGLY